MTESEEIKEECEILYQRIKDSQDRLDYLRKICEHTHTREGLYSWRIGTAEMAIICDDCGKFIKYKE